MFDSYIERCRVDGELPALIPQAYLNYDPYTGRELGTDGQILTRERMDFLAARRARVVLEVDGKHHYTEDDNADRNSPPKYAQRSETTVRSESTVMTSTAPGDTSSSLSKAQPMLESFFDSLLDRYVISQ